jgi:hypothetical protein
VKVGCDRGVGEDVGYVGQAGRKEEDVRCRSTRRKRIECGKKRKKIAKGFTRKILRLSRNVLSARRQKEQPSFLSEKPYSILSYVHFPISHSAVSTPAKRNWTH